MSVRNSLRTWRRGWALLLGPRQALPGLGRPAAARLTLLAVAGVWIRPEWRIRCWLLLAAMLLVRAFAWRNDLTGGVRDALLAVAPLLFAPGLARVYRRYYLRCFRAMRSPVAGGRSRCCNNTRENTAESFSRPAGHIRRPAAGRDRRGGTVR